MTTRDPSGKRREAEVYVREFRGRTQADAFRLAATWLADREQGGVSIIGVKFHMEEDADHADFPPEVLTIFYEDGWDPLDAETLRRATKRGLLP